MLATPRLSERAASMCGPGVEIVEMAIDDSWFRDSGPIYVFDDAGERVATDWIFNAWGEKFHPFDADAAAALAFAERSGHPARSIDMVFEGGSITGDGDGTLVTTTQCLMHPNRNPTMTQVEIDGQPARRTRRANARSGCPHGLGARRRHRRPRRQHRRLRRRRATSCCRAATTVTRTTGCASTSTVASPADRLDARGRALDVTVIPVLPFAEVAGERVVVPYLNYYVGNGFVVVPTCGHAADADMVDMIGALHPGRDTVALDVGATLAYGGGGIHCITQQVPAVE